MADTRTPLSKIRRQILKRKGVSLSKNKKQPIPISDIDLFPKTVKMKYLEWKFKTKIENIIFNGSLQTVVNYFGNEVDRATISRWRVYVQKHLGEQKKEVKTDAE